MGPRGARARAAGGAVALVVCAALPARAEPGQAPAPGAAPAAASALPPLPPLPPPPESEAPAPASAATPSTPPPVVYVQPPPRSGPIPEESTPPEPAPERTWYGWQILLVDGASLALVLAGAGSSGTQAISDLGLVGYVAGGPTVHFAHGHVGRGFGSAGLRLGLPFAGALLGLLVGGSSCSNGNGCSTAALDVVVGALLGFVAAPVIDVAALAYDEEPSRKAPAASLSTPVLHLTPTAGLPRDSAGRMTPTLGFASAF